MLFSDDLVIITENLEELDTWYAAWKHCMEGKGLRVNLVKTKMMISDINRGPTFTSEKHPCGVCCKDVGSNSIFSNHCDHWLCKRFIVLNGRLGNVVDFKCRTCLNPTVANDDDKKFRLGNIEYEVVDQFCYLGDMLSERGGAEACSISRVRAGWKKCRELLSLLTSLVFLHKIKGKLYSACVRSVMLYCSDPGHWGKVASVELLEQTCKWYSGYAMHVSVSDRKSSEELRNRLGVANIKDILRQTRLR